MSTCIVFFFNHTATTEIYTLSLHDALPISFVADLQEQPHRVLQISVPSGRTDVRPAVRTVLLVEGDAQDGPNRWPDIRDRKSTRLNSSHSQISYAVLCLKKKKQRLIA